MFLYLYVYLFLLFYPSFSLFLFSIFSISWLFRLSYSFLCTILKILVSLLSPRFLALFNIPRRRRWRSGELLSLIFYEERASAIKTKYIQRTYRAVQTVRRWLLCRIRDGEVPLRSLTTKLWIIGCNAYFLWGNFYAETAPVISPGQTRVESFRINIARKRDLFFVFIVPNRDNRL